jgi:hypothetical protein
MYIHMYVCDNVDERRIVLHALGKKIFFFSPRFLFSITNFHPLSAETILIRNIDPIQANVFRVGT